MTEPSFRCVLMAVSPDSTDLHLLVKGRFARWWHHLPGVYIVPVLAASGPEAVAEVYAWIQRVWLTPISTRSVLLVEIDPLAVQGFLPHTAWTWFKERGPALDMESAPNTPIPCALDGATELDTPRAG